MSGRIMVSSFSGYGVSRGVGSAEPLKLCVLVHLIKLIKIGISKVAYKFVFVKVGFIHLYNALYQGRYYLITDS